MTHQAARPEPASPEWQWPIDPVAYDRSPNLSAREQEELALLAERFQARRTSWPKRTYVGLQRLLRPLQDVLTLVDCNISSRRGVLHLLLQEMHQRQQSFWGWTQEAWLDLLGSDATAFERRCHQGTDRRPGVMAVAYLLCGFADLLALGPFCQPAFAKRIFGPAAVEAALTRITQTLHHLQRCSEVLILIMQLPCLLSSLSARGDSHNA
jgi:hypothetical protein